MPKFWKYLLWGLVALIIVAIVLYAITLLNDQVGAFAKNLTLDKSWPVWLASLLGPVLYVFNRIPEWFRSLFPGGSVSRENELIKADQLKLRKEVDRLVEWREESLKREFTEITRLQRDLVNLDEKLKTVDSKIKETLNARPETFTQNLNDDEVHSNLIKALRDQGYHIQE
jgi:hypothetical protein